jgi:hypothetical protein
MPRVPEKRLSATIYSPDGERIEINVEPRGRPLEIDFSCKMTTNPQRNQGVLTLRNLSERTRNQLQKSIDGTIDYSTVKLETLLSTNTNPGLQPLTEWEISAMNTGPDIPPTIASTMTPQQLITLESGKAYCHVDGGEDDEVGRIFEGSVEAVESMAQGPDWLTVLRISDGQAGTHAAIEVPFATGSNMFIVVSYIINSMGLSPGNFSAAQYNEAVGSANKSILGRPFVLVNSGDNILHDIMRLSGAEWWVDRGKFFIVRLGQALVEPPVRLERARGGLRSKPRPMDRGAVMIDSDFRRDMRVGLPTQVRYDDDVSGYRADEVNHVVNNREGPWTTNAILRPIPEAAPIIGDAFGGTAFG